MAVIGSALVAGCAPTTGSSAPPVEVVVLLSDGDDRSLLLIPTDAPDSTTKIPLGNGAGRATTLAVRGSYALIGLAEADQVVIVNLQTHAARTVALNAEGTVTSVGFSDDGSAFATTPSLGVLTRIDVASGATSSTTYPVGPRATASARGKLFVLFGSRTLCTPQGPSCIPEVSWLSPYSLATHLDSIPMRGAGNPIASASAQDGTLYILNRGSTSEDGTLSAIDPIQGEEFAFFRGFGQAPSFMAFDGLSRLLIASQAEGLMVFNTQQRRIDRGAGAGIPLPRIPRALATDAEGRIYVVEAEGCGGTVNGTIRVFGTDLVEGRTIAAGSCPVAAAVTEVPSGNLPE